MDARTFREMARRRVTESWARLEEEYLLNRDVRLRDRMIDQAGTDIMRFHKEIDNLSKDDLVRVIDTLRLNRL